MILTVWDDFIFKLSFQFENTFNGKMAYGYKCNLSWEKANKCWRLPMVHTFDTISFLYSRDAPTVENKKQVSRVLWDIWEYCKVFSKHFSTKSCKYQLKNELSQQ